jgi:hypothetical protein
MYNAKQIIGGGAGGAEVLNGPEAFLNESLVGSDALLPSQLYGTRRGSAVMEPLKHLMMAILVDAIRCYRRNIAARTLPKRREFREAQNWLFKDRNDGPFSFDTVCYVLGTDPDLLRQRLSHQYARGRECGTRASDTTPPLGCWRVNRHSLDMYR